MHRLSFQMGGSKLNRKEEKMLRNLKVLGIAMAAVFAMSAVAASAASAQQGTITSDGPVTLTLTETGVNANFLKAFGLEVRCPGSTMKGHKVTTTPHTTIPNGSTEATLTPTFINCIVAGLNWPATVTMNGCDFNIKVGETTPVGTANTYGVSASLKCPQGQEVTLDIWTPGKHNGVNPPMCVIHFGELNNQNKTGPHLTDTTQGGTANDIDITGSFTGITATKTASAEDPILCPHAHTTTGELGIDATIKGDSAGGAATGVGLSHP
jgi:hypothetical protein